MSHDPIAQPGASQWIGKPMRRIEDARLLSGQGRFTDDVSLPRQAHAAFTRSPHAHARIARIDTAAACAAPGVVAVYTGADIAAAGIGPVPFTQMHKRPGGADMTVPPRNALTADEARFVGDAVAMVIAETREQARDAADLVEVEWDALPANADLPSAARADAPVHWAPAFVPEYGNIAAIYRMGDKAAADAAFASAAHVVKLKVVNQRVIANPIEPRALVAQFEDDRFTLYCPAQNTHTVRGQLAKVFGVPTSVQTMRSLSSATPNTLASWPRTVCVFCAGQYRVKRSASNCATSARGSIGLAITRWLTTLSLTTCAAAAKAASAAALSPMR